MVHCSYVGVSGYNLKNNIVFLFEELFTFTNLYTALLLGLHCLQKNSEHEYKGLNQIEYCNQSKNVTIMLARDLTL